jgi:ubiquinone/menaquinone biosynthesis C-methylase UbiE
MASPSHEDTRNNYNRLSRWYDLFSGSERRFTSTGVEMLDLRPGERVLEIGFGTGHALLEMARLVTVTGEVCGIDLSPGMLRVAEERLRRADLVENTHLQTGDATHLPYPDANFQAVFMGFTLELFPEIEIPLVLAECRRVLQPRNRLGIVSLIKMDTLAVRIYEWFHARLPSVVDCRPIQPAELLKEAGFQVEKAITRSLWGLPVGILLARIGEKE